MLSPGGATLGPGPDDPVENDDLVLTFATPVSAVGFDHLSQSADGFSFSNVTVFDSANAVLFSGSIPISNLGGGGAPAGADFWGIVSDANDIARVEIDEGDSNNSFPDCNIGYDTIRVGTPCDPTAATRARLSAQCSCPGATNHGAYVKYIAHAVKAEVKAGTVAKTLVRGIKKCAACSTCAKSDFVACCRTNKNGVTKCSVKHGAVKCKAPKGGSARIGTHASCCDACTDGACSVD